MREARVRLQRAVLHQFDGSGTRGGVRDDLVAVTVHANIPEETLAKFPRGAQGIVPLP